MKYMLQILILAFMVWLSACQTADPEGLETGIGIREELILHMQQPLSPTGPDLTFVFETKGTFTCAAAQIESSFSQTGQQVEIQLSNLHIPQPCEGGHGSAMASIDMPDQQGEYALQIRIGGLILNSGVLVIDYKGYRLNMETQDGMEIPYTAMHRIPQRLIWGYVYHPAQSAYVHQKFNDQIAPVTTVPALEAGHYGPFTAVASGQISLVLPPERSSAKPFALHYLGDPDLLQQSLADVKSALPAGTELIVYDWRGYAY